jgi:type II secretory pathway predicted ATPase ExeA
MELAEDVGGRLSVILAGHPKLRNDLRRPTMEEIGYRTDIFTLDGIAGSQRDYIHWLLGVSTGNKVESESILAADAVNMLATELRTPLQVQLHLTLELEAGYQTDEKPEQLAVSRFVIDGQDGGRRVHEGAEGGSAGACPLASSESIAAYNCW